MRRLGPRWPGRGSCSARHRVTYEVPPTSSVMRIVLCDGFIKAICLLCIL